MILITRKQIMIIVTFVFYRENLEWLARATNWAKFTATASLGVIHRVSIIIMFKTLSTKREQFGDCLLLFFLHVCICSLLRCLFALVCFRCLLLFDFKMFACFGLFQMFSCFCLF